MRTIILNISLVELTNLCIAYPVLSALAKQYFAENYDGLDIQSVPIGNGSDENFNWPDIASSSLHRLLYNLEQVDNSGRISNLVWLGNGLPNLTTLIVFKSGTDGIQLDIRPMIDRLSSHQKLASLELYGAVKMNRSIIERLLVFTRLDSLKLAVQINFEDFKSYIDILNELADNSLCRLDVFFETDFIEVDELNEWMENAPAMHTTNVYVADDLEDAEQLERIEQYTPNEFKVLIAYHEGFIWRRSPK